MLKSITHISRLSAPKKVTACHSCSAEVTIRTYDPDGRKLGSCEKIVEAALGLQEPGSERPSLASEESRELSMAWGRVVGGRKVALVGNG